VREILSAVLLAFSTLNLAVAGPAAPATGCARWKLNGYALGMTPSQAAAVRSAKAAMPDEGMVSVEVDAGVSGTLSLVGGRLAEYRVRFEGSVTSVAELRKQLVGKFGKATREVATGATTRLLWSDPACDRSLMAEWDQPPAETTEDGKTITPRPTTYTVALGAQENVVPYLALPVASHKLLE